MVQELALLIIQLIGQVTDYRLGMEGYWGLNVVDKLLPIKTRKLRKIQTQIRGVVGYKIDTFDLRIKLTKNQIQLL